MTDLELLKNELTLSDHAILAKCLVTRGQRKGALLKAPKDSYKEPEAFAAWHAMKAAIHALDWGYMPNNLGIGGMIMNGGGDTFERFFDATTAALKISRANKGKTQ
jgi:hypothetical protein